MTKILFQGDSITDAGRLYNSDTSLGSGYPILVAAELGFLNPAKYQFINKGISGNRSIDLLARIKRDFINLSPDVISILIGVNDVGHELAEQNGVSAENYLNYYNLLIEQIKKALPKTQIMIMEPFVLKASATEENWSAFRSGVEKMAEFAWLTADTYSLEFVPLMEKFDKAAELAEPSFWLADGVHPTAAGHELIAKEWIKCFEKLKLM